MAKITKIEPQKRNQSRYSLYIDDTFAFGISEDVYLRHRKSLEVGSDISQSFIDEVITAEEIQKTMDSALHLLSFRNRSEQELRNRLQQKGYEENWIDATLEKLKSYHYINDESFARTLAKDRQNMKKLGQRALKAELKQKGIHSDIITEVVDELCTEEKELEQATVLCEKRYRSLEGKDIAPKINQKLTQFLIRKGYSYDVAGKAIRNVVANNNC
ncbi:regulatory protein [Paenibacillus sp. 1182]|uniref:regulatory protein RecX n=1 Tax=Paenibacillus sp. 1182 TaxID=2806565 RepID=UPI001AE179BB|nr:RecX family transcriptional regulator [Paenibacillus sp. 1182]MBP1308856.1 regulatory protein [Paenibacillus sp. 1182]